MDILSLLAKSGKYSKVLAPLLNQQRNQLTNDKTGLSPLVTEGGAMAANAIVPGSGNIVKGLSGLDNMISGDGTSFGRNLAGDILNPLSSLQALSEGKFKEAIPFYGAFANAKSNRQKQRRLKEDKRNEYMMSQINRSKNLVSNQSRGTTMYNMGGLVPLSSSGGMIQGPQHEQGGVPLGGNVEGEGGEMMSQVQGGDYIFPNEETAQTNPEIGINPKTGNSYSEDIAELESKKGTLESKLDKRPNDFRVKNAIKRIDVEIEKLAQQHQQQLQANGVPTEGVPEQQSPQMPQTQMGQAPMGQSQNPEQAMMQQGQPTQQAIMQQMMAQQGGGEMQMKFGGKKKYNPGGRVPLLTSDGSSILNSLSEYAPLAMDNAFNYMQNKQRNKMNIPEQNTTSYIQPRLVNYDNQRQAISNQTRGMRDMISQTTNQSNIARANMQNSLAKRLSALGDINLAETNQNQKILSTNDAANSDLETRNNAIRYNNALEKFKWKDSTMAKDSQNVADLSKDIQTAKRDKGAAKVDRENQLANYASLEPRAIKALYKTMLKADADKKTLAFLKNLLKGTEYEIK